MQAIGRSLDVGYVPHFEPLQMRKC
jgi:hypothetical protein